MMRRTMIVGLLGLTIALAACGSSQSSTTTGAADGAQGTPGGFLGGGEMPLSTELPAGTLLLEGTDLAVTPAQAQELLPLWQMLRALEESGSSSQLEVEAILGQIQGAMTPEQLAAIEEMDQEDMRALFEELGMGQRDDSQSGQRQRGGFGLPEGMTPPEGMMPAGGGEALQGMAPGALGPEAQATIMAGRGGMGLGFATGLTDAVIELLETRAAES